MYMSNHHYPNVRLLVRRVCCAAFALSLFALPSILAQQEGSSPPAEPEAVEMEKIVVTGTLLPTAEAEGSLSVTPIDVTEPANVGFPRVGDLLRTKLPQYGGAGIINEGYGNGGNGASTISLRGLPSNATLLLVNGRRTSTSDLNLIPEAAIDRIEVLNDGAGAIYGTDAVAGVVNIILKEEFSGVRLGVYYGNTTTTDISERKFTALMGTVTEKSSFLVSAEFSKSNEQMAVDRDVSSPTGANVSSTSNPGMFTPYFDDPARVALRWSLVPNNTRGLTNAAQIPAGFNPAAYTVQLEGESRSAARARGEAELNALLPANSPVRYGPSPSMGPGLNPGFPYGYYTPSYRPHEKYAINMNGKHQLYGDNLTFFLEGYYVRNQSRNQLAPSPLGGANLPLQNYWLNSVFGPPAAGVSAMTVSYRPVELGPRITYSDFETFHGVAGFKGKIADSTWNWEAGFMYDRTTQDDLQTGGVQSSVYDSLLGTTTPDAWNPFGYTPIGGTTVVNSQAAVQSIYGEAASDWEFSILGFDGIVRGELIDLPGGALSVALGAEGRQEKLNDQPGYAIQQGLLWPFNTQNPLVASRNVGAIYGELQIPIVGKDMDIPAITSFSVSVALRDEEYEDVGNTGVKPRVAFRWQPIGEQLTLRGSYAQGFSAPGFYDLYQEPGQDYVELYNPYTGLREQPEDAVLTIGNPNLKPAEADTYLVGFVYTPDFAKGLTVGANYYNIEQTAIPFQSAQYIVNQWYAYGPTNPDNPYDYDAQPSSVNPLGAQVELTGTDELRQIRNVGSINTGERKTDGIDLLASYEFSTDFGKFTISGQATRVLTFEMEDFPGSGSVDYLGRYWPSGAVLADTGFPEWRANMALNYEWEDWNAAIAWNFTQGYTEDLSGYNFDPSAAWDPAVDGPRYREVRDYNTFDVRVGYRIPSIEVELMVGCNNVFDEQPPRVVTSFESNIDRSLVDLRGRMWFINVSKTF